MHAHVYARGRVACDHNSSGSPRRALTTRDDVIWHSACIEAGQEVASDGRGWTPLKLHGYQTRTLSALAPSPAARGYRIYVREVMEESY